MSTFRIERVEGSTKPVNSYVIDAPEGLIVVDGQLTVGDARSVRSAFSDIDSARWCRRSPHVRNRRAKGVCPR